MVRQYIGARYVPKFYKNSSGTAEWRSGVIYEPLTIVTYNGNSYTSKKAVPAEIGDPSANSEYWVATGIFNEQLNDLSNRVSTFESSLNDLGDEIAKINKKTNWYYPEQFGAVGDGETDDTAAIQAMFDAMPLDSMAVFTAANYLISDTIVVSHHDLRVSGIVRSEYCTNIHTTATNGVAFKVTGYGFSVNDITFSAVEKSTNGVTLLDLDADTSIRDGNIDAEFRNCCFLNAQTAFAIHGRNVRANNCLFSNLYIGLHMLQTVIDTDNRGYVVTDSRFHSTTIVVKYEVNNNRKNKNTVIQNNFCDMCDCLFTGKSGGHVIKGNTFSTMNNPLQDSMMIITPDILSDSDIMDVISDNVFNGKNYTGTGYGIWIHGSKAIITNNKFQYIGGSGIGGLAGSYIIATDNVFNNVGYNTTYVMQFSPTATGIVKRNIISNCEHPAIAVNDMTVGDNDVINAA